MDANQFDVVRPVSELTPHVDEALTSYDVAECGDNNYRIKSVMRYQGVSSTRLRIFNGVNIVCPMRVLNCSLLYVCRFHL